LTQSIENRGEINAKSPSRHSARFTITREQRGASRVPPAFHAFTKISQIDPHFPQKPDLRNATIFLG
jgi:hypothetical protein